MILITGATGHFGRLTIKHLLEKGVSKSEITALVRTQESANSFKEMGINYVIGDYNDYTSLINAFSGIKKLLFISGNDIINRTSQHQNVVNAAKEASVKYIVYTSFQRKNETETSPLWIVAQSHIQTEKWIKESGIAYTILKNNLYLDFLPGFIGENVLESNTIFVPAENGKLSAVLREDMAEAVSNILSTENFKEKEYDFTNSKAITYQEIADVISGVTGKKINYISPSADEYAKTLSQFGLPEEVIGIFSSFAVAQAQNELDKESSDLEELLGRKPLSIQEYLTQLYSEKK